MKDLLGVEVTVGCTVAYPRRRSSSCWLSSGRVVEVDEDGQRVRLEGGKKGLTQKPFKRTRWIMGGTHLVVAAGSV